MKNSYQVDYVTIILMDIKPNRLRDNITIDN